MDYCQHCNNEVQAEGMRTKKFCNDACRYAFHNKKKKKWTLKSLAKHYRETGEYLPEAEAFEEIYVMSQAEKIEYEHQTYIESPEFFTDEFQYDLDTRINLTIGMWQVEHGFTRPLSLPTDLKE